MRSPSERRPGEAQLAPDSPPHDRLVDNGKRVVEFNHDAEPIELSVVIPCLNEADTLAECVQKAQRAIHDNGIAGEVVVADNGSSDGSPEIAARLGARVLPVMARGYGSALMGGIAAARGRFIIMGD